MKKVYISVGLTVAIFLILLLHILYLRFVCDDAFISFRYAKNLVEGYGVVYNIGEKVEGYTNFLWTLLLSLFMEMGLDVVVVSQILGVLFSLATIFLFLRLNKCLYPTQKIFNYLGPLLLACCGAYATWSTGGLETSFFTFLIFLGSFLFILGIARPKHFVFSGLVFAFVCMTRLDGLIFAGITFLFLLYLSIVRKKIKVGNLWVWSLFFLAPFLVYFFWRWSYYEKFLPNSFYVKVGDSTLWSLGLHYLLGFIKRFSIWLLAIPLLFLGKAIKSNEKLQTVVIYFACQALIFSFYVVYVGGDFMDMFRFFVPVLPFFFFLIQEGFRGMYYYVRTLPKRKHKIALALEILLIGLSMFLFAFPSKESNKAWSREGIDSIGILRESIRVWSKVGLMFKSIAKPGESLATYAAGAIPYYSEMYTIDQLGLTLANQTDPMVWKAMRVGHFKEVSEEFLLSRRPTYILGHPRIYDDYEQVKRLWISERNGYRGMILTVKISETETKYLYCLSRKEPPLSSQ